MRFVSKTVNDIVDVLDIDVDELFDAETSAEREAFETLDDLDEIAKHERHTGADVLRTTGKVQELLNK